MDKLQPVAWMDGEGGFYHNDDYEVCKEHNIADDLIPLYFHPVNPYQSITNTKIEPTVVSYTNPVKELTMAEIEDFINAYGLDMGDVYEFSLAQLTKMIVEIEHQIRSGK